MAINSVYIYAIRELPCEACIYADSFDAAYGVIRELHSVEPGDVLMLRAADASAIDWLCPVSPCGPSADVAAEIAEYGNVLWDVQNAEEKAWRRHFGRFSQANEKALRDMIAFAEINLPALKPEARPELQTRLDQLYRELDSRKLSRG